MAPHLVGRNHLLRTLSAEHIGALAPHLAPCRLDFARVIEASDEPIQMAYFPDAGIISVVATSGETIHIEAGLIGYEGMTGTAVVLGDDRSPHKTYVQAPGHGCSIGVPALRQVMKSHPGIRDHFLLYAHAFAIQVAQTALANGQAHVEERLARWLAMADDRMAGAEVPLTHDLLGLMLGVRRAGVTDALHRLEGDRLIRARRGFISIRDAAGLRALAGRSYGVPEGEYRRLLGDPASDAPVGDAAAS